MSFFILLTSPSFFFLSLSLPSSPFLFPLLHLLLLLMATSLSPSPSPCPGCLLSLPEGLPLLHPGACLFEYAPQRSMHINQTYLMMSRSLRSPQTEVGCLGLLTLSVFHSVLCFKLFRLLHGGRNTHMPPCQRAQWDSYKQYSSLSL